MATEREKKLAIQILKERIEHATGKKVVLKENTEKEKLEEVPFYAANDPDRDKKRVSDLLQKDNPGQKARQMRASIKNPGKITNRRSAAIEELRRAIQGNKSAENALDVLIAFSE